MSTPQKTLKDYSELEKLTMSDAEFDAALEASIDELIEHMAQSGREMGERWREREPEAAARLDAWERDHPEEVAARERAGTEMRREAKESVMREVGGRWRAKRAAFQAQLRGATVPESVEAQSPEPRRESALEL